MNKQALTEEERRRRRNEASRRCYLKRKAAMAAKNPQNARPKAKPVEAKPAPRQAKPAAKGGDPLRDAERLVKRFAKTAAGMKPMVREAAEILDRAYRGGDEKFVLKVERVLRKGLGLGLAPAEADGKTKVEATALSRAIRNPAFRLPAAAAEEPVPMKAVAEAEAVAEDGDEDDEPREIPTDPDAFEKIEDGTVDKAEIKAAPADDEDDEDDDPFGDDEEIDDEEIDDEDEDDDDDDSEEAAERRRARREREDLDNAGEYETGRWEMMGEMGAQGAFDD